MRVILYLEKQADMGETCLLAARLGLKDIDCSRQHNAVIGDIDSREADNLVKVRGVSHIRKGQYAIL